MFTKSRSSSTSSKYSHLLYLNNEERDIYFHSLSSLQIPTGRPESTSFFTMSSSRCSSVRSSYSSVPESISTKPSSIHSTTISTPKYADDHYPLIASINPAATLNIPDNISKSHSAFFCARQMAAIHNTVIRALNASYNHATSIAAGTQRCKDFLQFNKIICTMLDHHHQVEDDFLFPAWEKLLGQPGAMEANTKGHETFMQGFHEFQHHIMNPATVESFDGSHHRKLIQKFAPELIQHLHDEIPTIANLYTVNSKALLKVWMQASKLATQNDDMHIAGPFTLGCQNRDFLVDGAVVDFPGVPWIAEVLVRKWFSRKHAGVWEFCPSDLNGQRRLLKA